VSWPLLHAQDISAGYGAGAILRDLSLSLNPAKVIGVIGRNGAGKSTLLRTLVGELPIDAGQLLFENTDISKMPAFVRSRIGIHLTPQDNVVFNAMTVFDNFVVGANENADVTAALNLFPNIALRRDVAAGRLSGGERKLLAFARSAFRPDKKLWLIDEPTEGVQAENISIMADIIRARPAEQSVLIAEQNITLLLSVADEVITIDSGIITGIISGSGLTRENLVRALAL